MYPLNECSSSTFRGVCLYGTSFNISDGEKCVGELEEEEDDDDDEEEVSDAVADEKNVGLTDSPSNISVER